MTTEDVSISGPVDVLLESKHRVVYDLMIKIAADESLMKGERTRAYWLTLYGHCRLAVVDGWSDSSEILKGWQPQK